MAADEGKVKIEKFDGADFGFWKMQIEDFLYQKNLYQPLLGKQSEGMKNEDWALLDRQALGVIRLTLSRNVAFNIAKEKTTTGLMTALSSMYEKLSTLNKVHLMRRLFNLRMTEGASVAQHLNELNTITTQLTVSSSSGNIKLKFDDVRDLVLSEEIRRRESGEASTSSALHTESRGRTSERNSNRPLQKRLPAPKKNTGAQESANMEETGDTMILSVNSPIESWILDSGASFHSTPCQEIMENYVSGQLDGEGYSTTFSGCEWKITKGALVIARGKKTGTLYVTSNLENIIAVADADGKSNLWHQRLGHMSEKGMKTLLSKGKLPDLKNLDVGLCEDCIFGKQKKVSFAKIGKTPKVEKLELVHTDVWGPSPVPSLVGSLYYVTFIDDSTRKVWVYFLKKKSEVFDTFRKWKAMVENENGMKVKRLRSDNGGEYRNRRFRDFCANNGIKMETTVPMTPQQNGVAERMNRTLNERARSMRIHAGLPKFLWVEAINTAAYLINRGPSVPLDGRIPEEVWSRKEINLSHLRVFGCISYVHIDSAERSKLDAKSNKCAFVGYGGDEFGYRFWDYENQKIIRSRDVIFNENISPEAVQEEPDTPELRRSSRIPKPTQRYSPSLHYLLLTDNGEPECYDEAMQESASQKWIYRIKEEHDGSKRYKARLVVKAAENLHLEQLDVKTAFLHGDLEEEIYMRQPEGFIEADKKNLVCRLKKSLCQADHCCYIKRFNNSFIILLLYVDDMLVAGSDIQEIINLKQKLSKQFAMKDLGAAKQILGMRIKRDTKSGTLILSQAEYINKVLSRFNMQDAKPISTPLGVHFRLSKEQSPNTEEERAHMVKVSYASAIGSLMYAMVCTRPDIAQAVGAVSRYMNNPSKVHWEAVKWILRYLRGTTNKALCFKGGDTILTGYVDADLAGNVDIRRSTTGYIYTLGGTAVSWVSQLQKIVALSTTKAEYVVVTEASKEMVWLQSFLEELDKKQENNVLYCDSQSVIHLAKNLSFHSKTKHIQLRYHFIRSLLEDEILKLEKISGAQNPADMLTKTCDDEANSVDSFADGRFIDVRPILRIIDNVLRHLTPNIDHHALNGGQGHMDAIDDMSSSAAMDGNCMLDALAYVIHKISCEISCKCSGEGDAHATTMVLLNMLSSYSWDAKVVLTLAAFAVNFGEFWLVLQLCTTNSLAKSVALLKQLPDVLEYSHTLKPHFDALHQLIKAMMEVTKCIVEFTELPSQYISSDVPPMSVAITHIPTAAYWTIRSVVACAAQITSLVRMRHEFNTSTSEAWELSSLAHKVCSIHEHLQKILHLCYQHIDEKKQTEAYEGLKHTFGTPQLDNSKILLKIFSLSKEDPHSLLGPNKTKVHIDTLRRKHVLLLISDLDIIQDEIHVLEAVYKYERSSEVNYEIIWLPIVDSSAWNYIWLSAKVFESAIDDAMPIVVTLDPQGKVTCPNALNMLWIWGNAAFPFTTEKEASLWKAEAWTIELLIDGLEPNLFNWMRQDKVVCLYGGEDIEWIENFTSATKRLAQVLGIGLEMVYVGKNNAKERVKRIIGSINERQLSHTWEDTNVWFFWKRLESMLFSKTHHRVTNEADVIKQEVMTLLGYDGSEQGWVVFFSGTQMVRAKGDKTLNSIHSFEQWEDTAREHGFVSAIRGHLEGVADEHHCTRLILPGNSGGIAEKVVCAECGRPMEKYFMYRCCVE
ncbi:omega-6 fatty acid desaturase, endoplasmic reticulum isozyme 1 [Hibiscus syriacus]|uniref:Omega-6 fatty acid desaturase, endoplasmic reticulum isozyme 1 n=1 Tax=Hibiscus syriacus TaxID=106335 RepID=A0A6A3A1U7_HIBSY|nr:omega-6 fatty acid desaturase, endoplasmic reticulum isozyme 1 [Hibiscus syriacus]